jgi:hypothetical protein
VKGLALARDAVKTTHAIAATIVLVRDRIELPPM